MPLRYESQLAPVPTRNRRYLIDSPSLLSHMSNNIPDRDLFSFGAGDNDPGHSTPPATPPKPKPKAHAKKPKRQSERGDSPGADPITCNVTSNGSANLDPVVTTSGIELQRDIDEQGSTPQSYIFLDPPDKSGCQTGTIFKVPKAKSPDAVRQARFVERMKAKGFKQKQVWIYPDREDLIVLLIHAVNLVDNPDYYSLRNLTPADVEDPVGRLKSYLAQGSD